MRNVLAIIGLLFIISSVVTLIISWLLERYRSTFTGKSLSGLSAGEVCALMACGPAAWILIAVVAVVTHADQSRRY
jgi:hypothetical protein